MPYASMNAVFEDLMDECRRHASAAGAGAFPSKTKGMFLSILFAHHKALKELQGKIGERLQEARRPTSAEKPHPASHNPFETPRNQQYTAGRP